MSLLFAFLFIFQSFVNGALFNQTFYCKDVPKPWPKGCKVYQGTSPCDTFELDPTGQEVVSCETAEVCAAVVQEPRCLEYYPKPDLSDCDVWFDGCNNCKVYNKD